MGFATLPNQVHRKSVKKGFDFTLMVAGGFLLEEINMNKICFNDFTVVKDLFQGNICYTRSSVCLILCSSSCVCVCVAGESGMGKSTLVNSLFLTDLYKDRKLLNAEGPSLYIYYSIF